MSMIWGELLETIASYGLGIELVSVEGCRNSRTAMAHKLNWIGAMEKAKAQELSLHPPSCSPPHTPQWQRLNHCGVQQTGAQGPGLADGLRCFWFDEM